MPTVCMRRQRDQQYWLIRGDATRGSKVSALRVRIKKKSISQLRHDHESKLNGFIRFTKLPIQ